MMIVCLGDSTTAGTPFFKSPVEAPPNGEGDSRGEFAHWLRAARPSWQILNRGVNGERSDQISERWSRDVQAHHPAVVVIIAGVNDVYQGREAAHVIATLGAMYDKARADRVAVVAGSIVPFNTATPDQNARMRAINAWIAAQASPARRLWFADTRRAAADSKNIDRLAGSPDGLHPDIDGYHRMADALLPAIDAALA
jgi:lysophospholipase L1-like esterase